MLKRQLLLCALLLVPRGLASFGQAPPIVAKITPALTGVKVNQTFAVSVVVRNISSEEQSLQFWTCGEGIVWSVDNPQVRPQVEGACTKPGRLRVALKPGEKFERTLHADVAVADGERIPDSVTFRLKLYYDDHGTPPKSVRFWSNPVAINVAR